MFLSEQGKELATKEVKDNYNTLEILLINLNILSLSGG